MNVIASIDIFPFVRNFTQTFIVDDKRVIVLIVFFDKEAALCMSVD